MNNFRFGRGIRKWQELGILDGRDHVYKDPSVLYTFSGTTIHPPDLIYSYTGTTVINFWNR